MTDCDWVLIGHSHFDHLYGAEVIASNTGATLVGSYETVRVLEALGVSPDRLICVAGGETVDLGEGVRATAYPSLHSCVWADDPAASTDEACLGGVGLSHQEQQARFAEKMGELMGEMAPAAIDHVMTSVSAHSPRGDGGALLFHIETPEGSILFQDTNGHWSGIVDLLQPDVAIVAAAGRANVDGEPIQGSLADFVADHVRRLQPRQVVLSHHDNWLPGPALEGHRVGFGPLDTEIDLPSVRLPAVLVRQRRELGVAVGKQCQCPLVRVEVLLGEP